MTRVVERKNVRVLQSGEHSDLPHESHFAALAAVVDVENFYGDLTFMPRVVGQVDRGERSLSDLAPDFVSAGECSPKWCNRVARAKRIRH